jgi:hypothetical protein
MIQSAFAPGWEWVGQSLIFLNLQQLGHKTKVPTQWYKRQSTGEIFLRKEVEKIQLNLNILSVARVDLVKNKRGLAPTNFGRFYAQTSRAMKSSDSTVL